MWREIKYWIADKLFENELDDAFDLGIIEGHYRAYHGLKIQIQIMRGDATKAQLPAYDKIIANLDQKIERVRVPK